MRPDYHDNTGPGILRLAHVRPSKSPQEPLVGRLYHDCSRRKIFDPDNPSAWVREVIEANNIAQVFSVVVLVFESIAVKHGIGTHRRFLADSEAIEAAKWSTLTITPNVLANMMTRISLCFLMLRIAGVNKYYRGFLVGIIVGTTLIGTATVLNTYVTCRPVPKMWTPDLPGTCNKRSRYAIGMTQAVWTIGTDWLVALFPILLLRQLKIAFKAKIVLLTIMSLGFL